MRKRKKERKKERERRKEKMGVLGKGNDGREEIK